jgi:hypothetical protein
MLWVLLYSNWQLLQRLASGPLQQMPVDGTAAAAAAAAAVAAYGGCPSALE